MPYRPLSPHELNGLSDDELVAYLRAARDAGDVRQAWEALAVLVYGHWPNVLRRVTGKVLEGHEEQVAAEAIHAALVSTFAGESAAMFRSWLHTIVDRRIADYHRRRKREPVVVATGPADDENRGRAIEPVAPSHEGFVEARDLVDRTLATLSPLHAQVVEARVLRDRPTDEVAEAFGLTPANVDQIVSRFRRRLRDALSASEDS